MAGSPVSSASGAERGVYQSDEKTTGYDAEKGTPIYGEEPLAEEDAIEFGEVKELRFATLFERQEWKLTSYEAWPPSTTHSNDRIGRYYWHSKLRDHKLGNVLAETNRDCSLVQEKPLREVDR